MAYIGPEPNPGQNREVDDISSGFNGGTASFTLQVNGQNVSPGSANAIIVSLGGVVQNPGTDYTVAASTLTFTTAPANGLSFFGLVLGQGVDTSVPSDGSVTTAKLASGAADLVNDTTPQLGGNLDNNGKNITFGDSAGSSDDRLTFGAGTDLSIYHDNSNSRTRIEHSTDNALQILQGGNAGMLIQNQNSHNIEIKTNAEDAIKCVANGAVELYHDATKQCETSANGLAFPSGKGIDFSATSDGSGTSNVSELLTDFETGTFSLGGPVIGGGSFTATVGRYTRIGNVCHVFVVADSFSTSGQNHDLQLSGLPFASSSSNASHAVVSTNAPSFSSGIKANIPSSNTIMAIRTQWGDDGLKSFVFNGYGIAFNATYIVG